MSAPARTAFAIQALTSNFGAVSASCAPNEIMWTKPTLRSYKLNLDTTFHDDGTSVVGIVLHNCFGEAIAGAAEPFKHVWDAMVVESLAMLNGIELLEG